MLHARSYRLPFGVLLVSQRARAGKPISRAAAKMKNEGTIGRAVIAMQRASQEDHGAG